MARRIGAWRSLVARLLWEQEAGGSNPSAPTNIFNYSPPPAQLNVRPASWEWSQAPTFKWESKSLPLMPLVSFGPRRQRVILRMELCVAKPAEPVQLDRAQLSQGGHCQVNASFTAVGDKLLADVARYIRFVKRVPRGLIDKPL